ncbi:SpoIVB peptidase [Ammoniphilus resinae]|uniref:Stage IV sporulation protein B n=1 Tax=Ammoniphilus resinae TaxID=861532 RepID=A0ABS4GVT5_9BACL|nr:SpoIVB peptidase [Ammoniphilus resinae]MBP1934197.1 stage IV sporulation protein B [Ammoniphilus resinae]
MSSKIKKKWLGFLLVALSILTVFSTPFQEFASLPDEVRLFEGSVKNINLSMPVSGSVTTTDPDIVGINGTSKKETNLKFNSPVTINSKQTGQSKIELKVGNVPIKTMSVNVLKDLKVYPGGQSIGVQLQTAGVLVVGHHLVDDGTNKVSPGEAAKIQVGDMILKINGMYINDIEEVGKLVQEAGEKNKPLSLLLARGEGKIEVELTPALDAKDKAYRMGLYIRDSAAGVGTLTFYDPESKKYGALGHVISDIDTGKPIVVGDGHIVQSQVTSIEKGQNGAPGEKFAIFKDERKKLGNIVKNSPFGIFGTMDTYPDNNMVKEPIPIALTEEVKEGPAEILTVVDGQKVEKFDIEIVNVIQQQFPATKGMIIKVTDPDLLKKTGGIVQGMSGSPIIQNGKLVGAVTHVFVNDPTSGYGLFIEWMLKDAGVNIENKKGLKAS